MKKSILLMIAIFVVTLSVSAETKIEYFAPNIIKVTKSTVDFKDLKSYVVLNKQQREKVTNPTVLADVDSNGDVTFTTKDGTVLLKEGKHEISTITQGPDSGSFKIAQTFLLDKDEPLYGVGLLQNGQMSQRGLHRMMIQNNQEDFANFYHSLKGYGIYWDNYSPTRIDDNAENGIRLESQVADELVYYFIYGGNADGVISGMRHLSGSVPMLPLWTYGFHQSRERYKSSKEVLSVVRNYRERGIPLDGIIQDWQYWDSNYLWNAMEFLAPDYLDGQKMIDSVHAMHAKFEISVWASFGPHTKQYKELSEKDLLYSFATWPQSGLSAWPPNMEYPSGVKVYVPFSRDARAIYWKYLSHLYEMGVDGWWMDSTDPDHFNPTESDFDEVKGGFSFRKMRNAFPLASVAGVYLNQRKYGKLDKRPFILTRSYFAGQQRYGANTWTGDITSNWDVLRKQVPMCLNYTLTANPNVNTDIGGFFANRYNSHSGAFDAQNNARYQELYVRWMQFGLFCPMMRSHGTEVPREVYLYGKQGEPVYDALVNTIKMRYRLLPYIYSTAWQVSKHDDSFMRALFMDWRDDSNTWNIANEYMFGRGLLIAPVLKAQYTDEETRFWNKGPVDWTATKTHSVYLPKGTAWYDFYTGEKYEGGQTITIHVTLDKCPVFVPEGTIIPLAEESQYTSEKNWDKLQILVFPGKNAEFTLYEDAGDGFGYEKGEYKETKLVWNEKRQKLTIPGKRTFEVKIMGR